MPRARFLGPRLMTLELVLRLRRVQDSVATKAGFPACINVHGFPHAHAFDNQRQLAQIAAGLPAPAPVMAGLLARDDAFFEHDRVHTAPRERQRGRHAHDSATHDHHARFTGKHRRRRDRVNHWTHTNSPHFCSEIGEAPSAAVRMRAAAGGAGLVKLRASRSR